MSESVVEHGHSHADEHHHHDHPAHLQHHFETEEQQFDASKIGMWLFLATEILLFGGLFCAYSVYRANHPEIFLYAHKFLDVKMGGINTAVLIFSSFTMAWGVRLAQLGKKTGLVICLVITILCGFGFLGIKYVEYKHKWEHGLLWGTHYHDQEAHGEGHGETAGVEHAEGAETVEPAAETTDASGATDELSEEEKDLTTIPVAAAGPSGTLLTAADDHSAGSHGDEPGMTIVPENVHIFFGIYFSMTGLHALHVIIGMGSIFWALLLTLKGKITKEYFTPIDLVGLYWHLVDLIWIYLFPLLYLIH